MRHVAALCSSLVLAAAGCGGASDADPPAPAGSASPTAETPAGTATPPVGTATSPAGTATPASTATAPPAGTPTPSRAYDAPEPAGGTPDERAARRALVAWYEAQRVRDGEATCALMTPRARAYYAANFGGPGVSCAKLFGPDGAGGWSVAAGFAGGAARAAEVTVAPSGRVAAARILDETQALIRVGDRWLVDQS